MSTYKYRNIYCNEIDENTVSKEIKLAGFVENIRDHGGVIFVDLRDETGVVQLVSNDEAMFLNVTRESSVALTGTVRKRNEEDYNLKLKTGKIEILVETFNVLSKADNVLPFEIQSSLDVNEELRLKYRYLDLRNKKVHDSIVLRSNVIKYLRDKMNSMNFLEIQTPILTASSPEGARDFIVPSRKHHGKFYALPQAPQIFKQLLMVSGFDKYFQVAPCFRDEDARADRTAGEFYQLDLEMAFVDEDDVYEVAEIIFTELFEKFSDKEFTNKPFVRIPYQESIDRFGTDKPDLRNPIEIIDITECFENTTFKPFSGITIKGIVVDNIADKSNSWFNELVDFAKKIGMPGIGYVKVTEDMNFVGPIDKFLTDKEKLDLINKANLKANSVLFFIADKYKAANFAGEIRTELGKKLDLIDNNKFAFCIINDFPMFEYNDEEQKYDFTHNPFSMPKATIEELNTKNPLEILASQYDVVCNGVELVSGAIRNYNLDVMRKVFEIAGYPESELQERFKSLYTAFQFGAPPHGGMAIGIDRMLMLILDKPNIRETIAFPMSSNALDLMMGSPSSVSEQQLREVHIKVR